MATKREEEESEDLMVFSSLNEIRVEITTLCPRCQGAGARGGRPCDVCDGDRNVMQKISLYKLAKLISPVIIRQMIRQAQEAEVSASR